MAKLDKACEVCKKKAKHEVEVLSGLKLCKKHYDLKLKEETKK